MPKSKNRRKPKGSGASQEPVGGAALADVGISDGGDDKKSSTPRTSPMQFFREVRDEARKITWTSRNETLISTVMVLIMVLIASIFFFMVDEVLRRVIPMILNITA